MKLKNITASLMTAALLLPLSSCLKDKLLDSTHAVTGRITVSADWSILGEDSDMPERGSVYRQHTCSGLLFRSGRLSDHRI